MNQSMALLFWIYKSRINKKGLATVYLRITIRGIKTEISTGINVLPDKWDSKKGVVRGNSNEVKEVNRSLDVLRGKVLKIFNEMQGLDTPVSAEQIKSKLFGDDDNIKTLLQAFTYHNELIKRKLGVETTKATYGKFETLKKKVTLFINQKMNRKDVFLKELNHRFAVEFEAFLKIDQKITHNPAIKYVQFLKKIIHLSIANGWLDNNPFRNFKCSLVNKDRECLTESELQAVEDKDIELKRLVSVRDAFVLSCYTGLSYADIQKLRIGHIINKEYNSKWIIISRTKTEIRSPIPLLPKALKILNKYDAFEVTDKTKPLLPIGGNQKMNAYLKEIADICGISKNLTYHLARHTFATTVTLSKGVPIETVSKMLGHTNLKTTQIYAKVVDTKIANDMKKLMEG